MQSDRSNEVFTYWTGLRHGRAAPSRTQIDPTMLRRHLPDLFMLDWEGPDLKFRLAGTRMCESFGRELHGEHFLGLWQNLCRDLVTEAALTALRTEEAVVLEARLHGETASEACEMLFLPIRSGPNFADRLLGSMVFLERPSYGTIGPEATLSLDAWVPAGDSDRARHEMQQRNVTPIDRTLLRRLAEAAGFSRRSSR